MIDSNLPSLQIPRGRFRWAAIYLLVILSTAATSASAQQPSSGQMTVSDEFAEMLAQAAKAPAGTKPVAQTNYAQADQPSDIWSQVAALRSQVQSQDLELAALRQQLHTPSSNAARSGASRWFVTYESVLLQPVQSNSVGILVETTDGYSAVAFPWQLEHSPRIQMGSEASGDSLGWRFRYWTFRHNESFDANDTNGLIPIGNEGTVGYLSEDGDITTGLQFIENGTFISSIRTDVLDWEFQRELAEPVDVYGGLRYAKIAQGYAASTDQGAANAYSEFRGIGPTVAMRFLHNLPLNRLALFANLRGSLLFGHKEFSVADDVNNMRQSLGDIDLRSFADGADTLASNAEMQLGLRYSASDWMNITVAIEGQHYANVGGPNPVAVFTGPDGGLSTDSPMDDSLSFLGLSLGAELIW